MGQRGIIGSVSKGNQLSGHTILDLCLTNSTQILALGSAILLAFLLKF